jgi:hypothetical protein
MQYAYGMAVRGKVIGMVVRHPVSAVGSPGKAGKDKGYADHGDQDLMS